MAIYQYDGDTAFINGVLEEDLYIHAPEEVDMRPDQVLKLNRSLHGLKQDAVTWFKTISSVLLKWVLSHVFLDSCVTYAKMTICHRSTCP